MVCVGYSMQLYYALESNIKQTHPTSLEIGVVKKKEKKKPYISH